MIENKVSKSSNILWWLRTLSIYLVSIAIFWIIATNRSPNLLRPLSMLLRTGYTIVVPILFISLYVAFRIKGWFGKLLSMSLSLSIFALALSGVWADGKTEAWLLSGVIPMFDATNYYIDALRLIAGQPFSEYSANKPLFPAFFTVLLWIADHNLIMALIFLTLLVALGCYLLATEIKRTHGPAVAALALLVIFIYYRIHSGIVRTENLGILFSVLGMALIWRGIAEYKHRYFFAGMFITSLAMIARPGPLFILPAIAIWGAFFYKPKAVKFPWKFLLGGGLVISMAFFVNMLIFWILGARDSVPFGRFPYALYGLVSGGNSWAYVLEINPTATEPEIYKMAYELFKEQPALVLKGIQYNLSMFVSNTGYGIYSYMRGESDVTSRVSYWVLISLALFGILNWVRKRDNPFLGFVIASSIGVIVSVPFLPPTDAFRLRLYASSIVVLALLPSLGFHEFLNILPFGMYIQSKLESLAEKDRLTTPFYTVLVLILVFFAPLVVRGREPPPRIGTSYCSDGGISLVIRYDPGTMIRTYPQTVQFLDWTPDIHIGTFRGNAHDFPSFDFTDWALEEVTPNTTMFYALDYHTFRDALVVVESDLLPSPPALLELCGGWEASPAVKDFNIFYPSSVNSLD
ncbi:MAG: hypothetical protein WBL25_07555 [Anaerolineales bacterium]